MRYLITYYHPDMLRGDNNMQTTVIESALESFVKVLLSTGHVIISIE